MSKQLSEMSLEELWQLFPIFLTEHRDCWADWFLEEKRTLQPLLPEYTRISHIGSTAVEGIWAKPIIDVLVELMPGSDMAAVREKLTENGYFCMSADACRVDLNKGYTPEGFAERVFHIHVRFFGDNDELYFKRYLSDHKDTAAEYEKLKLALWKQYEHDRDGYTGAKTDFIKEVTKKAKAEYSVIETPRLRIRPSVPEDLGVFYDWERRPEVTEFFSIRDSQTLDEVAEKFRHDEADPGALQFTITLREMGQPIGRIVFADIQPGWKAELWRIYIADTSLRGKGLGKEAMLAAMDYAFGTLGLQRLYLDHYTGNPASALYLSLGFRYEGILRKNCRKNGKLYDVHLMSMLREEYEELYK